ncbi:chromosomal replication initiator protein DnaA [Candidatus Nomurabacteria bacterium RIFCSPHIGHO2_02_FULL_33_12]|uniref:Chromosomal replication initiator protein DnaA n=1 Tax=Candidatus Nomurabacteria bacterium RIFCSPLOWO2_01_FULL_33_17 TaxID=1801764 RepID=A0A1F6WR55_9BACT|nr:MAG: chromosomal replication initiator protein DnaA [Candidatus Nomurabacteria bacterium RIFCSPHIGHO2_02_FULL_33_12]OGI84304.1 MAG: chromosomal replication initiator protein DnaA [Candidatus Nomurabacteria bacterium RIFCSPLOWO2_01_FULL_33_17]
MQNDIDPKKLWEECMIMLERIVSRPNFTTWFKQTHITKIDDGVVSVGVPNEFAKDWLYNKFHKIILKTLVDNSPFVKNVEFIVAKYDSGINAKLVNHQNNKNISGPSLGLNDVYVNKEDGLNPRYTFETMVVGSFNELANAGAQAVVRNPGTLYNPYFIYGNTGLGKTHMIEGIGNAIKKQFTDKKVYYTSAEKFVIECISAVQNKTMNSFKDRYRHFDVLIMDDIQMIGKGEKIQDELFHLFNMLYETNKQIVFSSDKHPNYITGLEDRLRSRFSQGMIVDVHEPDYESRVAIIRSNLSKMGVGIPTESIEYIASSVEGNIRELEGNIKTIALQIDMKKRNLTLQEIKDIIKNSVKSQKQVSIEEVVKIISSFYHIENDSIYEKTRRKEVVHVRQIIMYILREDFNLSFPFIGQKMGGKDHTTVIHSYEKIKKELDTNTGLMSEIERIRSLFK